MKRSFLFFKFYAPQSRKLMNENCIIQRAISSAVNRAELKIATVLFAEAGQS